MFSANNLVFASPKCTYSSESLFKHLIYVPALGKHIPCLFLDTPKPAGQRGKVLLYFHGNAEDLGSTYN